VQAPGSLSNEIVIAPPRKWGPPRLGELWQARELLYFITKRELQIRYKQSFLGVLWVVLQPLVLASVFALFLGQLARVPSDGTPYPLFALTGLATWLFASQAVAQGANSLVGDANLVSKVYFPRLVIPIGRELALLVDVAIALLIVLVATLLYGLGLRVEMLLTPLFVLLAFATALGAGTLLAALNVRYRDVGVAIPLMVQLWLFMTPVLYPGSLITGGWQYVYALNPMVSAVQGLRWAVIGTSPPSVGAIAISVGSALTLVLVALLYFRRTEHTFADII
jgi:lipopolysaccharide transport system permease protein